MGEMEDVIGPNKAIRDLNLVQISNYFIFDSFENLDYSVFGLPVASLIKLPF